MRALVTGAAGFVGANLVRRLLAEGHTVDAVVRPGADRWRLAPLGGAIVLHEVALEDAAGVRWLVQAARPEWIFHLAAHGGYSWQTDWRRMIDANLTGTVQLLEACLAAGFAAFVHTGSSSEYGLKPHPPDENEMLAPNSYYAVTKAAATHACQHLARQTGARITTLRLYSVYGPWEEPRRFLPTLVVRGLAGELPPLVRPETGRDYVFVDDVTSAYLQAAANGDTPPGAVYNIGSGTQASIGEVVALARRLLDLRCEPEWGSLPAYAWDTTSWVADTRRARTELGWQPRFTLEAGLRATIDWLRGQPAILARYREAIGLAPAADGEGV